MLIAWVPPTSVAFSIDLFILLYYGENRLEVVGLADVTQWYMFFFVMRGVNGLVGVYIYIYDVMHPKRIPRISTGEGGSRWLM